MEGRGHLSLEKPTHLVKKKKKKISPGNRSRSVSGASTGLSSSPLSSPRVSPDSLRRGNLEQRLNSRNYNSHEVLRHCLSVAKGPPIPHRYFSALGISTSHRIGLLVSVKGSFIRLTKANRAPTVYQSLCYSSEHDRKSLCPPNNVGWEEEIIGLQVPACIGTHLCEYVGLGFLETPGSCSPISHPSPLFHRVLSFPSHPSPGPEMRLGPGAPRLPKRRRCLLEAPGVGAPGSSPLPPVPAPRPCLAPQAPRAPLGAPPCIPPCTRPEPALPGRREQHHPQAPVVASGEPPGGVVSTPSATASWAPLAFTGARCRVRGP